MAKKKPLTPEQRKIVEDNLALATYVAKRYLNKGDYNRNQDIIQEARMALINAIPNYNPEMAKLSTYIYPNIDGHLKRLVGYKDRIIPIPHQKHLKQETQEKAQKAKTVYSLDKKISNSYNDNSEEFTLMDVIPDNLNLENSVVNRLSIIDAIKKLNWQERLVITYRFYFDLNQTTIGLLMGISQVHAHRLEKKALKNIKAYLIG